ILPVRLSEGRTVWPAVCRRLPHWPSCSCKWSISLQIWLRVPLLPAHPYTSPYLIDHLHRLSVIVLKLILLVGQLLVIGESESNLQQTCLNSSLIFGCFGLLLFQ